MAGGEGQRAAGGLCAEARSAEEHEQREDHREHRREARVRAAGQPRGKHERQREQRQSQRRRGKQQVKHRRIGAECERSGRVDGQRCGEANAGQRACGQIARADDLRPGNRQCKGVLLPFPLFVAVGERHAHRHRLDRHEHEADPNRAVCPKCDHQHGDQQHIHRDADGAVLAPQRQEILDEQALHAKSPFA